MVWSFNILIQADDEILIELRRCQGELKGVSQHNLKQLKRLYRLGQEEMKRQEIRKKLIAADAEVVNLKIAYKKTLFLTHSQRFILRCWTFIVKWPPRNRKRDH